MKNVIRISFSATGGTQKTAANTVNGNGTTRPKVRTHTNVDVVWKQQ